MTVTLKLIVEDVADQLALGYDRINLERSTSVEGTYANIQYVPLVAEQYYYTIVDSGGTLNSWYRYRYEDNSGTPFSEYSDPFRVEGTTRLRVRQGVLDTYGAGIVFSHAGSGAAGTVKTSDPRLASSLYRTDKWKGTWVRANTGLGKNQYRLVTAASYATSVETLTISPDWSGGYTPSDLDEFEHHRLVEPKVLDDAIVRASGRYYYVDRVPIQGAGEEEIDLTGIPWLVDMGQIHDVRWYPNRTTGGVDDGIDESWAQAGKWFKPRKDADGVILRVYPAPSASQLLWIETTRPMQPLYTDESAAPAVCAEELMVALAWDELLAYLSSPVVGTSEERDNWKRERLMHGPILHGLLRKYRPKPQHSPSQSAQPPSVPRPFRAR